MEHEKEIQEIKDRLTSVESQLKRKSQSSGTFKILVLIGIIFLVLFLILIGLYQFPSRGTT
ncbi:hypothetical protein PV403_18435 [Paenibacillus sp. GYB006]|uniref:hypothetical protein n=1 Tax=Paenibacillus sp. GYB006 TaxID=2994394 RepID=UPI002F968824